MLRKAVMIVALQLMCTAASGGEWAPDVKALIEGFQSHRRVADGYLRTQNLDLGAIEIERLRDRWRRDRGTLSAAANSDARLTAALRQAETHFAGSLKAADGGEIERARQLLNAASAALDELRSASGLRLFSDCIAEIGTAYAPLDAHRVRAPDLSAGGVATQIAAAADVTADVVRRCEAEAGDDLRKQPEFRRLVDGMLASLAQVPAAVAKRDQAWLHRLLIEQRSFERLMVFRFG